MPSPTANRNSLRILLSVGLIAWVVTFIGVHGPGVIVSYLILQGATSGVFAFFMWKAEQDVRRSSDSADDTNGGESNAAGPADDQKQIATSP